MVEVMNIIKVAVGTLFIIGAIVMSLTLTGCRAAVEAEAKPPVIQETEVVRYGPPAPSYTYSTTIEK